MTLITLQYNREPAIFSNYHHEPRTSPSLHRSPTNFSFPQHSPNYASSHAHPPSRHSSIPQSPAPNVPQSPILSDGKANTPHQLHSSWDPSNSRGVVHADDLQQPRVDEEAEQKPTRTADPMSFSSILSSHPTDPTPKPSTHKPPAAKQFQRKPHTTNGDTVSFAPVDTETHDSLPLPLDGTGTLRKPTKSKAHPAATTKATSGSHKVTSHPLSDKENEKVKLEMEKIDAIQISDIDGPAWANKKEEHALLGSKRQLDVDLGEESKRKVSLPPQRLQWPSNNKGQRRRIATTKAMAVKLDPFAEGGKARFRKIHENAALEEVQRKEVQDEKERKKDMQRKRRREKTLQQESQKQSEALVKLKETEDPGEREKLLKEASKAAKKLNNTKRALEKGDVPEEIREVTPLAPNLEGGTMSTFQSAVNASPEPPKKRQKGPAVRPKKSKEKKQAEKDAAEAAYAAMEKEELVAIAPKEETRRETLVREIKETRSSKDVSPASFVTNYASKGYAQIYEQIWKDIARKDVNKVNRIAANSYATKISNLKKTAQLAAKEARRWQLRTNKGTKDVQARSKRSMREMMGFWKRNEREERESRKGEEKRIIEETKRQEADREANRQKRKLNFLISQTELYSHFIGRKIKTDEVERSTDSAEVTVPGQTIQPGKRDAHIVDQPDSIGKVGTKVTNFEDLDFDAEDETTLRQAAMANAQSAVQEAQDRARAFNGDENQLQSQFDEGEMNFQNPTSLGDVDVAQPTMLAAQLKEYQLKGLNWLVNLYEQGINGILADEMGLGKTVQSISVMAYLAEKHNIWGPFLVIAPSSTLHNWQQEITRFVPGLKCLPYWGNAKDRKILRKFWDRKHITYSRESQFHVLITSYQLVVQDTQYFQKIRWQYMILDEAQAIKSSQSSRWKSLLGFHCRNRLLLTGTPIQNNMQELWALLHFIMPSLFDSHDEFSDWFSKDIESHAQSNTKLNEDQLKRLHMILKPFMLRRIKKHVQKELGDKVEEDVYCDLTYRQRAYYGNLRNRISIMDLIEKATVGDEQDTASLMNLVMQFRKVCNHPDLFERAETTSPVSLVHYAETVSFMREGHFVHLDYSTRNLIEYDLPRLLCSPEARLDVAGPGNEKAGFRNRYLAEMLNIWSPENIRKSSSDNQAFSWLRFVDTSASEAHNASRKGFFERALSLGSNRSRLARLKAIYDGTEDPTYTPAYALFNIVERNNPRPLAEISNEGHMRNLLDVSKNMFEDQGFGLIEPCARPGASAPPIEIACSNQDSRVEKENTMFNVPLRKALYNFSEKDEAVLLEAKIDLAFYPVKNLLPLPLSQRARYNNIKVPSMRRFVTDAGKLARLDQLLRELKEGGHRVLLYFQMTRMIDLMEEYLTYRNYKYLRLDGSTKLEDRRDTVHDFQTRPDIFVFLLSTRAGGLGINLTAADTVIFYDSDWNPTIDSQAMDRAHRLGQTKQVTVYRMITRGTIEERIRKRALQKEEVQRVVISGGGGAGVDFNTRSKDNRTKDIALWLADDEQAEMIEKKEKEVAEKESEGGKKKGKKAGGRKKDVSLDDMYHEGMLSFSSSLLRGRSHGTPD